MGAPPRRMPCSTSPARRARLLGSRVLAARRLARLAPAGAAARRRRRRRRRRRGRAQRARPCGACGRRAAGRSRLVWRGVQAACSQPRAHVRTAAAGHQQRQAAGVRPERGQAARQQALLERRPGRAGGVAAGGLRRGRAAGCGAAGTARGRARCAGRPACSRTGRAASGLAMPRAGAPRSTARPACHACNVPKQGSADAADAA